MVSAVRDGDRAACAAVMPFLSAVYGWRYIDVLAWTARHERAVFVDVTLVSLKVDISALKIDMVR